MAVAAPLLFAGPQRGDAAELKLLGGSAVIPVMTVLVPGFEQSNGYTVVADLNGTIGGMTDRILKGETADVVIVSRPQIDKLELSHKVVGGSSTDIAKVGIGVFVRKGDAKPDIGSVDAFKTTMLSAKSIGWNDPAAGAPVSIYMIGLLQRLGIAEQVMPKVVAFHRRSDRFEAVARGDVEIGFNQVSEILAAPGVELVGPLPKEIQNYTLIAAGICEAAEEKRGGMALIGYISSPAAGEIWKQKGFSSP